MLPVCLCVALWLTFTLLSPPRTAPDVDREGECTTNPSCHDGQEVYGCFVGRKLLDIDASKPADVWVYVHLEPSREFPCEAAARTEAHVAIDNRDGSVPQVFDLERELHEIHRSCADVSVAVNHRTCLARRVDDACGGDQLQRDAADAGVTVREIRYDGGKWRVTAAVSGGAMAVLKKSAVEVELVEDTQANRERLAESKGVWEGVVPSLVVCGSTGTGGTV